MCGIAAIVAPESVCYKEALHRMMRSLRHRGPDGEGSYFFKSCALGHTRLSVVDLESGGQPMLSTDGKVGISFNGEICDYRLLKSSLDDYPFRTSSDTEVIMALYRRYGIRCLQYLKGMFGFAVWDDERHELICARDRFGEKPLYYAVGIHGEFVVASEIKAILASGLIEPVLNRMALVHYLQHLCVPANQTIFSNVHVLPPAHTMRVRDGCPIIERYWSLPPLASKTMSLADTSEEFHRLFRKAVERCLVADVPVGLFLSGGLDSSSVVAEAAQHAKGLHTFFFDFEQASTERDYARDVAVKYRTNHVEMSDSNTPIADLLLQMQSVFDEPFADSSNIPTWLLSRHASYYVKVVLAGDGGDELLAGYSHWYRPLWYMERPSCVFESLLNLFESRSGWLGKAVRDWYPDRWMGMDYRRRFRSPRDAHFAQRTYFSREQLMEIGLSSNVQESGPAGGLEDVFRDDVEDYLPSDILTKVDRASMAHGLEVRSPFLDVDLASFCISLPLQFKMDSRADKLVLRKALSHAWPATVRTRGKQGFGGPVEKWLRHKDVGKLKVEYLDNPRQKLFSVIPFDQTRGFTRRSDSLTWILLVLAIWMDQHNFATGS